jgi:tetratricopeptide (TPR) repeat protein
VRPESLDKLADPKDKLPQFRQILAVTDAFKSGDFAQGEKLLKEVEASEPELYLVPFMLGEAALRKKEWDKATTALKRALELNPQFDQAMTGLSRALQQQGQSSEAREWLQRALQVNPQNFRAWYQLAWLDRERPEQAATALRKTLEIQPKFPLALRDLGMLEFSAKNYAKAADLLKRAIDSGMTEIQLRNYLGIAYSRTGRFREAVQSYQAALKEKPDFAEAHLNLGFAYQSLRQSALAQKEYREACRLKEEFCSLTGTAPN